jgi:uncharacterized protein (DUF1330 family)
LPAETGCGFDRGLAIGGVAGLSLGAVAADFSHDLNPDPQMITSAYMVVTGTVTDRDAFRAGDASKLAPLFEKYGGRYIAIGGKHEVLEGETGFASHVISEWPGGSADARAFWTSPEYAALKQARIYGNWGRFDVFLVEGVARLAGSQVD